MSAAGNSYRRDVPHSVTVDVDADLASYDALPPCVRQAIREARAEFSAIAARDWLASQLRGRRGRVAGGIVATIAHSIRAQGEQRAREIERALYGTASQRKVRP